MMEVFQCPFKSSQEQRCLSPSENEEKQIKTNALMHNRTEKSAFAMTRFDAYKGLQSRQWKSFRLCVNVFYISLSLSFFFSNSRKSLSLYYYFLSHIATTVTTGSLIHMLCLVLPPNLSQLFEPERDYKKTNPSNMVWLIIYLFTQVSHKRRKQDGFYYSQLVLLKGEK